MNPPPGVILVIYCFTFLFTFIGVITIGKYTTNFGGNCILFAQGNFTHDNDTSAISFTLSKWGSTGNCAFIYVICFFGTFISFFMGINNIFLLKKQIDRTPFSSFAMFVCNCLMTIGMFAASIITSSGYASFCSPLKKMDNPVECDKVDVSDLSKEKVSNPENLFSNLQALQFAVWFSMFLWATGGVLSFFKVWYFHKNNDLLQSLAYEKDRLINHRPKYSVIVYEDQ